jgi:hypothetical protein
MSEALDIYFSQVFDIEPDVLEAYGAFDVSLINDLPLFVHPFLLFNSKTATLRSLHDEIIRYIRFLRDKAAAGELDDGLLEAWFTFREVKQNWLGFPTRSIAITAASSASSSRGSTFISLPWLTSPDTLQMRTTSGPTSGNEVVPRVTEPPSRLCLGES